MSDVKYLKQTDFNKKSERGDSMKNKKIQNNTIVIHGDMFTTDVYYFSDPELFRISREVCETFLKRGEPTPDGELRDEDDKSQYCETYISDVDNFREEGTYDTLHTDTRTIFKDLLEEVKSILE